MSPIQESIESLHEWITKAPERDGRIKVTDKDTETDLEADVGV